MSESLQPLRDKWRDRGDERPDFAIQPSNDQESVWDYPRPPAVTPDPREVEVAFEGNQIACSKHALRVLETAGPPVFYLPPSDVNSDLLRTAAGESLCEWKGVAKYFDIVITNTVIQQAAWSYQQPLEGYENLADYVSFYPGKVDCLVAGQKVRPQHGNFYGGWVTNEIVGPWKGQPGTETW